MNKGLILTQLLFFAIISVGQNIIPIPADSTSEWRILNAWFDGMCVNYHDSRYFIDGQIDINGQIYDKLYSTGVFYQESVPWPPGPCDEYYTFQNDYLGGLRTDSGKVYFHNGYEELLLYDFTLNVGDTLSSSISPDLIISGIDSVYVGDEYRRRFNFSNGQGYCDWMIEGIGHQAGLIEPMYIPLEYYSEFICYAENHIPIFPQGTQCELNVNIHEPNISDDLIKVFPNPSTSKIYISIVCEAQGFINYSILNILGEIVLSDRYEINIGYNRIELPTEILRSGLYFIKIDPQYPNRESIKFLKIR